MSIDFNIFSPNLPYQKQLTKPKVKLTKPKVSELKKCFDCGKDKEPSHFYIYKDRNAKYCKACTRRRVNAKRIENKELSIEKEELKKHLKEHNIEVNPKIFK